MKNHLRVWLVTFGFGMKSKIDSADFIEQNLYEAGFSEFYKNKIKSSAAKLEEIRMKHLKKIAFRGRLTFLAWLVLPMLTLEKIFEISERPYNDKNSVVLFIFLFGFLLTLPLIVCEPVARFKREFEEELFKIIFEFFGKFKYESSRESELSCEDYRRFKVLPPEIVGSLIWCNQNYVSVSRQNINCSFERLEILCYIGNLWPQFRYTFFNGTTVLFDFSDDFEGFTIIINKSFFNSLQRAISEEGKTVILRKVEMGDREFSKMFTVYSKDSQDAQNLINPAFRAEFKKLPKLFNSKKVQARFCDKKLLLAIGGGVDLLQLNVSVFKPINLTDECRQILKQMDLIFSVVTQLKKSHH